MVQPSLHKLVFQAAKEILAEGKYPTMDLICDRLNLNPQQINDGLDISSSPNSNESSEIPNAEIEILEALTLINRLQEEEINQNTQQIIDEVEVEVEEEENFEQPNHNEESIEELVEKVDRKAQYMAAAEAVLTQELYRYYRNTHKFSVADVKHQVENALLETQSDWEDDIQNFSPAVILKKYGKSSR